MSGKNWSLSPPHSHHCYSPPPGSAASSAAWSWTSASKAWAPPYPRPPAPQAPQAPPAPGRTWSLGPWWRWSHSRCCSSSCPRWLCPCLHVSCCLSRSERVRDGHTIISRTWDQSGSVDNPCNGPQGAAMLYWPRASTMSLYPLTGSRHHSNHVTLAASLINCLNNSRLSPNSRIRF